MTASERTVTVLMPQYIVTCLCWQQPYSLPVFTLLVRSSRISFKSIRRILQTSVLLVTRRIDTARLNTYQSRIAQLVWRLATGWTVRGSNAGGSEIFRTRPDRSWGPPSLLYNGYRVFPGVKRAGRGVDHPPHLVPRLKKE